MQSLASEIKQHNHSAVCLFRFMSYCLSWLIYHEGLVPPGHTELTVKNELGNLTGATIHTRPGLMLG